jgi:hypothetical protein
MGGGGAPGKGPAKPKGKPAPTGKAEVGKRSGTPFPDPSARAYLATARDNIARSVETFFKAEAGRVARDVLRSIDKVSIKASDHTDPDQHGVSPVEDPHRTRAISAAVTAALAGINFQRWSDLAEEISPPLEDAAGQTVGTRLLRCTRS